MAVQIQGADGVTIAAIDVSHKAQRISIRPPEILSWNSVGAPSGLLTGVIAGAALFSLRNAGSSLMVVRRLSLGWLTTTTFTAAQRLEFALMRATGWSVADTGGSPLGLTSGKHRTSLITPSVEAKVATTTGITAGTRTLDAFPMSTVALWSAAVGAALAQTPMFSHDAGDYPLVLGPQEGLVVNNIVAMGAAGVGMAYINAEFAVAETY